MSLELVSVTTADGLRLDGTLRRPAAGSASQLGIDAVILHHGFSGNFYGPSMFAQVQESFATAGVAVLRVNNRGHDLVYNSPAGRRGATYETLDESRLDWRAWLDYAEAQGYQRVLLWGHSLGAVKTAYYVAHEDDARVVCAIASSPPRFSFEDTQTKAQGPRLKAYCDESRRLVESGRGEAILDAEVPGGFRMMSAQTYLDKWGPGERYNVLRLVPQAKVPVLVTMGSLEGVGPEAADWFQFGGFADAAGAVAAANPNVRFEVLEGANHAYAGKVDQVWSTALMWLKQALGAAVG